MSRGVGTMLSVGLLVIGATNAFAQAAPQTTRGFVNVNVMGQAGSEDITKALSFELYQEPAAVSVTHKTGGVLFDVTGGIPVRGPWSVGVNVNRRSSTADGKLTGQIPDPIHFDKPRSVTGTVPDMSHQETWLAGLLFYDLPVTFNKMTAQGFFGPAVANVNEYVVQSVAVTEPNDQPLVTANVGSVSKSLMGVQLGVDLKYPVTDQFSAGVLVRYQRASGTLPGDVKVTLGGFQVGAGIRFRF